MSRLSFTNHLELHQIIGDFFTNPKNVQNRLLVVIGMAPAEWLQQFANTQNIVCITADTHIDQSDQISALLGAEHKILAHEVSDPLDASLLAALAGTVIYSGMLIIATPFALTTHDTSKRLTETDTALTQSDNANNANNGHNPTSFFNRRFAKLLNLAEKKFPGDILLTNYHVNEVVNTESKPTPHIFELPARQRPPSHDLTRAKDEQNSLLQRACGQLSNSDSLCISIIGKRGRGKSALTARIANWLHDQNFSYRITALHNSAVSTFHSMTDHDSQDYFIPTQQLKKYNFDTLLVEEASNIPLAILMELMTQCSRLILCTTVEGYESSGRAFELRIQQSIKMNFESQLLLSPTVPWRWLANDPIESVIDSIVLNDNKRAQTSQFLSHKGRDETIDEKTFDIRKITQQQLFDDENELKRVFTLLRDTHYQTTVKDLQHLLDGKDVLLWVLEDKMTRQLMAVLLLTVEQGIENSLHQKILRKQRRLPHRLLSQLLAQTANSTNHLTRSFARVVRISVVKTLRRRSIGSKLLKHVEQELIGSSTSGNSINAIGASFANDSASVEFWRCNQYITFHKGYRKNPRTGEYAVTVLKTQDSLICAPLDTAAQIFNDNQAWRQARSNSHTTSLIDLHSGVQHLDQQLLEQFAKGYRSMHDTYAALSRLSNKHPVSLEKPDGISRKRFERLLQEQVSSILQLA